MKNENVESNDFVDGDIPVDEVENTVPLAYEDYYLSNIVSSLNDVKTNQHTMINNQDTIIASFQNLNSSCSAIVMLVAIIFCYLFIDKILNR